MERTIEVTDNEQQLQFQVKVGQELAFMEYRWYHGDLAIMHTYVPEIGRGKGYSTALAEFAIQYAREKSVKLKLYCMFMQGYIKRHPEFNDLISKL